MMYCQANILTLIKKIIRKVLNLKLEIKLECNNTKVFLQKAMFQIGLMKFLRLTKVENTLQGTYVISDITRKEIVGTFYEKELQKINQKEFRVEKVMKR